MITSTLLVIHHTVFDYIFSNRGKIPTVYLFPVDTRLSPVLHSYRFFFTISTYKSKFKIFRRSSKYSEDDLNA